MVFEAMAWGLRIFFNNITWLGTGDLAQARPGMDKTLRSFGRFQGPERL